MDETSTKSKEIVMALAGNPNVGKTVIFNELTGAHQHVGNWPGVTVERKEGILKYEEIQATIVDLPGIYALTAYSIDERIAREFLIKDKPDVTVVIVDASNIERNFYLVMELMELNLNLVIVLNMMDDAKKAGIDIDIDGLSKYLNLPVVSTIAIKGEGIEELKKAILYAVKNPSTPRILKYSNVVENAIYKVEEIIEGFEISKDYPKRWFAIKLLEKDAEFIELATKYGVDMGKVNAIIQSLENKFGEDSSVIISEERYGVVHGLTKEFVRRILTPGQRISFTDKIDKVLCNRALGIPLLLILMWLMFKLTFSIGGIFSDWIDSFFGWLGDAVETMMANSAPSFLISFIKDGVIGGVGSVLVFLPNIFFLFLMIAFLEEVGYMARAAFVMDKIMHSLGLHGKSFIPMILGFGCNVPAIMATRTIESEKDRILTILVNPLMSCSARLPIYILFVSVFFKSHQGLVVLSLYIVGVVLAIFIANLFNKIFFKSESTPLIMELPPYRIPKIPVILGEAWRRSSLFLKKAGTIIFATVIIIWILASLPLGADYGSKDSVIGHIGEIIAPVLKPLGFGYWQAGVALIFGTLAKEVVVGTFGVLFGEDTLTQTLARMFTPLSAYSFMLFSLIYVPCIASIGVIWREAGKKWALFSLAYLIILAYVVSALFYQLGSLFV